MLFSHALPRDEWIEFPAPQPSEPGIVRVLRRPDTPDRDELLRRVAVDAMTQPYIFESRIERRLHFTRDCTQSVMLLREPVELTAPYTRTMMACLLLHPQPRRILMLGLGGGSLAKFCYQHLPQADITAVEVNADIIALRHEFHIPRDDHRFRIVHTDGAAYMQTLAQPVDVMLVDAFDPLGIAHSIATPRFYQQAALRLSASGVLVMNYWGDKLRYSANLLAAATAFGANLRLVTTAASNVVLFAGRQALPQAITPELDQLAQNLQRTLQLDFPQYLRRLCQGESLMGG